jgi:fatty-acid desaturase
VSTDTTTPPVGTVRPGTGSVSRVVMVVAVVVPPVGTAIAMAMLWGLVPLDRRRAAVSLYVLCAFGTTIGFHRYFTHRGFEARVPVKVALGVLGCMTMQGPIIQWVTDHPQAPRAVGQAGRPPLTACRPR